MVVKLWWVAANLWLVQTFSLSHPFYWAIIYCVYSNIRVLYVCFCLIAEVFFLKPSFSKICVFCYVFISIETLPWPLNIAALRHVPHPLRPSNIRVCLLRGNGTQSCRVLNTVAPFNYDMSNTSGNTDLQWHHLFFFNPVSDLNVSEKNWGKAAY